MTTAHPHWSPSHCHSFGLNAKISPFWQMCKWSNLQLQDWMQKCLQITRMCNECHHLASLVMTENQGVLTSAPSGPAGSPWRWRVARCGWWPAPLFAHRPSDQHNAAAGLSPQSIDLYGDRDEFTHTHIQTWHGTHPVVLYLACKLIKWKCFSFSELERNKKRYVFLFAERKN